jgi:hypothetical protein
MSRHSRNPRTVLGLARAIVDELEREFVPPYGVDEEYFVQLMIEKFLKNREAVKP